MDLDTATSGQTIPGTKNAEAYATRIALGCHNSRSCGIAIVNCTEHRLVNPRSLIYAGSITSRPAEIDPDCTGLIAAEKKYMSSWGAVGLISYSIEGTDQRLQILYDVPLHRLLFKVQANVMVGFKSASEDLFAEMYKNLHGEMTFARCTMHSIANVASFDIEFLMEDTEKSPLTVYLRPHKEEELTNNGVTQPEYLFIKDMSCFEAV